MKKQNGNDLLHIQSESYRKIQDHPCFSSKAVHRHGRLHLPVAPKCNIQCNYCLRKFDCVNESRPGVTSKVISPDEAIIKVDEVIEKFPNIKVVGIAGPGEPLFNQETFSTMSLVKHKFPGLKLCVSTNGLLLPEKLSLLKESNLTTLTVTVNTLNPEVGAKIYSHVIYKGRKLTGAEGAEILLSNQLGGIGEAIKAGIVVKINSVLIPSVNNDDILRVAKKAKDLGAYTHNVIPLIPQSKFSHIPIPSKREIEAARKASEKYIRQMRHCRRCRADAVGLLHQKQNLFDICK